MDFYKRYTSWVESVDNVIDTLYLMEIEADWKHILEKEQDIDRWMQEIRQYNLWREFEAFALSTEQRKIDGFFSNVEKYMDEWVRKWSITYNHVDHEEFKRWFYHLAYKKLKKESKEADRIALKQKKR